MTPPVVCNGAIRRHPALVCSKPYIGHETSFLALCSKPDIGRATQLLVICVGNPVPLTTQYVLVSNLCPECKAGDLDQEIAGDGRWTIEWYPVQCAVGSTPLVYSFQGSNAYYIKMQISNHRWAAVWSLSQDGCMLT